MVIPLFGDNILMLISKAKIFENYIDSFRIVFNVIKWPLTLFIVYFNIKLIYTIAPSKNIRSEETTYGAMFTTIMWLFATLVFKFYLEYFARYDILYGNLSAIIIMIVWIYFLSYVFVLGIAINVSRKEEQELIKFQLKIEEEIAMKKQLKEEKAKSKKNKKKAKTKKETNIKVEDDTKNIESNDPQSDKKDTVKENEIHEEK